ncbi:MAG: PQQ-dependent catabolism-associated CXXCW motif protein [Cycloclasticus sp.]|nr:PQQ-dependent catabolism-associated CXXCW motif protein [Cycloclasticus sp.]
MMKYALIKTMVAILVLSLTACASKGLVKPQDEKYRGLPYLVPTTEIPPTGVKRISARELKNRLSTSKRTVLIDVYGAIFREETLDFDGAWLVSTPRKNLPTSVWLPTVGKQKLNVVVEQYYRQQLKELTANDTNKVIVIYCVEDCWMAWNAAKRAKEWGYNNVWWFREGVDGWLDNGWQLQNSVPINLPVND